MGCSDCVGARHASSRGSRFPRWTPVCIFFEGIPSGGARHASPLHLVNMRSPTASARRLLRWGNLARSRSMLLTWNLDLVHSLAGLGPLEQIRRAIRIDVASARGVVS